MQLILEKLDKHELILNEHSELLRDQSAILAKQGEILSTQGKVLINHNDRLEELTHRSLVAFEVLSGMAKQTNQISKMRADLDALKRDVGLIKQVLTDSNNQIRSHEHFIKHVKAAT